MLFPGFSVDDDGDGAIVGQGDLHVGSEFTGLDRAAEFVTEFLQESLVEGNSGLWRGGASVRGTVALLRAGVKGELTDDQCLALDLLNGSIHEPGWVAENAEPGNFAGKPVDVGLGIGGFHGEQDEQSLFDRSADLALDLDGRLGDTLDDGAH